MSCDSDRGSWSTPTHESRCPDCGAIMPVDRGPMTTWMATRHSDRMRAENARKVGPTAFRLKNQPRVRRRPVWEGPTERQQEIARIVEKHGGNRAAAARELGVTGSNVITALTKLRKRGLPVPEPARKVAS